MAVTSTSKDTKRLLSDLRGLDGDARREAQGFWFPLVVFGGLTILSAPLAGTADMGTFWAFAGPAGAIGTAVWYGRRDVGVQLPAVPYVVVAAAIIAGAFVGAGLGPDRIRDALPYFCVAAGYVLFAGIERSGVVLSFALLTASVAGAFAIGDAADSYALPLLVGSLGVAIGMTAWIARRRHRA